MTDEEENSGSSWYGALVMLMMGFVLINFWMTSGLFGCSDSQIVIDEECRDLQDLEDSFLSTWRQLERNNPQGIGSDLVVAETQLENKEQVLKMIKHLQDNGEATCFSQGAFNRQCLPVNTTGGDSDSRE